MKLEEMDTVIDPNTGKTIDMKKLLQEQQFAMIFIDSNYSFFSTLLSKLKFIYTFQVPTQATDGTRIFVNPSFTAPLSIHEKAFVMMHEIMHCALDHMARGKSHEPDMSNIAADYEVNQLIVNGATDSGKRVFTDKTVDDMHGYLDHTYDNDNYEMIYAKRPKGTKGGKPQQGGQIKGDSKSKGGSGSGSGKGNQENTPKSAEWVDGWNKALADYKAGKIKL